MRRYLARRLLLLVPVLAGVSIVIFLVLHLSPGDPAEIMLGSQATKEDLARLREQMGLNEPLPVQYVHWISHVLRGDLGRSLWMKRPVLPEVLQRLKATLLLTVTALVLSTVVGLAFGVASAAWPRSLLDRFSAAASLFGASMPSFWLGIVLMVIFALWLGWLPASGMFAPYGGGGAADLLSHLVLPAVTLAAASVTIVARLTRSTMLEALGQDYIRTARSKGVREVRVHYGHAFRNALLTLTTLVGLSIPGLFGGALLIEYIFAWPGMGSLTIEAVGRRDYTMVQATTLLFAFLTMIGNMVADILYGLIDPRVRVS